MQIELTEEQQQTLDRSRPALPLLVDPRTKTAFVLVPQPEFESIRELLEEERQQRAIHAVALVNAVGRMNEEP